MKLDFVTSTLMCFNELIRYTHAHVHTETIVDCKQKTKYFQLKFDLTGLSNDTKIYIQISRLIKSLNNSTSQCYLDINVENNNNNIKSNEIYEISAEYILRENCVSKNFKLKKIGFSNSRQLLNNKNPLLLKEQLMYKEEETNLNPKL